MDFLIQNVFLHYFFSNLFCYFYLQFQYYFALSLSQKTKQTTILFWASLGLIVDQIWAQNRPSAVLSHSDLHGQKSSFLALSLSLHRPKPIWPKPLSPATGQRLNLHSHTSMAPPTATTSHSEMALTLEFLPPKTHSLISRGQPRAEPDEHHHHSRQHSSKAPPQLVAAFLSLSRFVLSISLLFSDLFVSDSIWVWGLDLV